MFSDWFIVNSKSMMYTPVCRNVFLQTMTKVFIWKTLCYQLLNIVYINICILIFSLNKFTAISLYLYASVAFSFFFNSEGGAVYIRWGRKSCPEGTQLVYTGIKYMIDVFIIKHTHTHTHINTYVAKSSLYV